jgi:hypothetical protein
VLAVGCPIARLTRIVMQNASVEKTLRWMLAAWMLLVTSVTSSTIVHGHSGGNLSHQHDKSDCTLSRSFVPVPCHDGHNGDANLSAVDIHRHGCFTLLGAVTYLPIPGEPTGSHGKSPIGWETIVVVSSAQSVRTISKALTAGEPGHVSLVGVAIGCTYESKQRGTLLAGIAPVSSLCDRARHERSGVQLT